MNVVFETVKNVTSVQLFFLSVEYESVVSIHCSYVKVCPYFIIQ